MATYNDISTVIKNIDGFLGTAHVVKFLPERYSSTPTKSFKSKTEAQAYAETMKTKYGTAIANLNTKWKAIKTKADTLKSNEATLTDKTVIDLIPGMCNISYSEVFYKIAASKHLTVKTVKTVTDTSASSGSGSQSTPTVTTTTVLSVSNYADGYKQSGFNTDTKTTVDPDPNASSTSGSQSSASASTTTTTTVTTTTEAYWMFPLTCSNRWNDTVYDWSVCNVILWHKWPTSNQAGGQFYQFRLYNGTYDATSVTTFENYGKRWTDPNASTDSYSVDTTTHKTKHGSTEINDTTQGHNYIKYYYWWVREPENDTDAGHTAGTGQGNTEPTVSPWTKSATEFKYGSLTEDLSTYKVTYSDQKSNTHEYSYKQADSVKFQTNNDSITTVGTYYISHNLEFLGIDENPASIKKSLTPYSNTLTPKDGYSIGTWSFGNYNTGSTNKCGGALSFGKVTEWTSPTGELTNQLTNWLNYYNKFAAVGEWTTPARIIEYLADNVVPLIPKKYIDLDPMNCNNAVYDGYNGGGWSNTVNNNLASMDYNSIKRTGNMLKALKYDIIPNLTSYSGASKTVNSWPVSFYTPISVGSEDTTWIQLYYTATAIRRAWRYYTGMTLTDNVLQAIMQETAQTNKTNTLTINGTVQTQIPKGWFDDYGDYGQQMKKVDTTASNAATKYYDTTSLRFNANDEWGTSGLDYMKTGANGDAVVEEWAQGTWDTIAASGYTTTAINGSVPNNTTDYPAAADSQNGYCRCQIAIRIQDNNITYYLVGPSTSTDNATNQGYQYCRAEWTNTPTYTANKKAITTAYLNAASAWDYIRSSAVDTDGSIKKWCTANNFELIDKPYGATLVVNDLYNRKNDTSADVYAQYTNMYNKDLMCFKSELLNGDIKVTTDEY